MDDRILDGTLYALVKDGIVENIISYQEGSNYRPPSGFDMIKCTDATGLPTIGLTYENGVFEQPVDEVGIGYTPK